MKKHKNLKYYSTGSVKPGEPGYGKNNKLSESNETDYSSTLCIAFGIVIVIIIVTLISV